MWAVDKRKEFSYTIFTGLILSQQHYSKREVFNV